MVLPWGFTEVLGVRSYKALAAVRGGLWGSWRNVEGLGIGGRILGRFLYRRACSWRAGGPREIRGESGEVLWVCGLKKAKRHPVLVPIFRVARRNCRTTLRKPAESGNKSFACVCVKCPIGGAGDGGRRGGAQAEGELCNVDGQADPQSSLSSYLLILPLLFPSQFPFILPYLLSALTSPLAAPAPDLHPTTHSRPPTSPPANLFSAFPHSVMLGGRWQGVRK